LDAQLEQLGLAGQVLFPGYVGDAELVALYQACHLFVFPSLYEGFGLPVAEALACGAPALASGTSSLVELVSETAQFDPRDPNSIRAVLELALTDESFRVGLRREERPAWRDVADRTVEAYEQVRSHRRSRLRLRLAFVSPASMPGPPGNAPTRCRIRSTRLFRRCTAIGSPIRSESTGGSISTTRIVTGSSWRRTCWHCQSFFSSIRNTQPSLPGSRQA